MTDEVLTINEWPSNAELIADVARLGYLQKDALTLDCTFGAGTFWKIWCPNNLIACDIIPKKSPIGYSVDFRNLPWPARHFTNVVFDPPYKLNGTPDEVVDERYGVDLYTRWQDRHKLCREGIRECVRVCGDGYFLLKCKNQVSSGKKRFQIDEFTEELRTLGFGKVDEFFILNYRPQPKGRRQVHTRENASALLVFQRDYWTSDLPRPAGWGRQPTTDQGEC